jgi:hypothetical protein
VAEAGQRLHPAQLIELPLPRTARPTTGAATPNIFSSRSTAYFWISIGIFISLFSTPVTAAPL